MKDSRVHLRGQLSDARNARRFMAAEDRWRPRKMKHLEALSANDLSVLSD